MITQKTLGRDAAYCGGARVVLVLTPPTSPALYTLVLNAGYHHVVVADTTALSSWKHLRRLELHCKGASFERTPPPLPFLSFLAFATSLRRLTLNVSRGVLTDTEVSELADVLPSQLVHLYLDLDIDSAAGHLLRGFPHLWAGHGRERTLVAAIA